jgi:2-polyprenyl-6-methoxyphenol hydroxylase-like FAD-dependent oxidoreductase
MLAPWQNSLVPFATRYTPLTIEPEEPFIMFGAGSPISNFHNRRCAPNCLTPTELKAELIERTSSPGIHPRFAELARMVCTDTAYVFTVRKCDVIRPWESQNVTLLGDAVFNMSNTLSRGANCALLDAVSLAECLTSPSYDRRSPTGLDSYVKENIERRLRERHRSLLMQKIMFFGQNRLKGYVRNKALPLALRRIDELDREEHRADQDWVADDGSGLPQWEEVPQWVEELRWEELYDEQHGERKEDS